MRYPTHLVPAVCVGLAVALAAPAGFATVVLPADFGAMVEESQTIVHGVVSRVDVEMPAGRRSLESVVTVRVATLLKGADGATVVFLVPNGRTGRFRRITIGAPEFAPGDEVILFLKGRPPAVPMPYGLSQGVYRVARGADGRGVVVPPLASDPGRVVRGDPARRPMPVETFAQYVRAAVTR